MQRSTIQRLSELSTFTRSAYVDKNRGQALVSTVHKAVELASDCLTPAAELFEILLKVMIGESLSARGKGPWFVGNKFGSMGFQQDLKDRSDQSAHAVAGMYMGWSPLYPYGVEQIVSLLTELAPSWFIDAPPEWQDMRLYSITSAIGRRVNDSTYQQLPEVVLTSLCDKSVKLPARR